MRTENVSALIGQAELFAGLARETVDLVLARATLAKLRPEAKLLNQGDPSSHLYLVARGRLKMTQLTPRGEQIILRFMGPGDLVGCAAVFRGIPYPATATAVAETHILSWAAADFMRLLEEHPGLSANALKTVGGRAEEFIARFRETATEPVATRLARALLRLCGEPGRPRTPADEIELSLTRQDLAELTGTTLYTVSRIVSAWEQEGLVRSGRKRIVIREPAQLARMLRAS